MAEWQPAAWCLVRPQINGLDDPHSMQYLAGYILCQAVDDYLLNTNHLSWPEIKRQMFDSQYQEILSFWCSAWALELLEFLPALRNRIFDTFPSIQHLVEHGEIMRRHIIRDEVPEGWVIPHDLVGGVGLLHHELIAIEACVSDGLLEKRKARHGYQYRRAI